MLNEDSEVFQNRHTVYYVITAIHQSTFSPFLFLFCAHLPQSFSKKRVKIQKRRYWIPYGILIIIIILSTKS